MRLRRLLREFGSLRGVLTPRDFSQVVLSALTQAPQIVRTGRLRSLDAAMSRDIRVRYRGGQFHLPLPEIDQMLGPDDNPTFGNVRELYARDCYFGPFRFNGPVGPFLDLGANRGMVSIMALSCLGANRAIGVEPQQKYEPILQLLLQANNLTSDRAPLYTRFITSPSLETRDTSHNVSIQTIRREQGVDQFGLVKIDIEGGEIDLFREPDWLAYTQNIAMEVHPAAGDLSGISAALLDYGFTFVAVDQSGAHRNINDAMFVYASRNGSLIPSILSGNGK